MLCTRTIRGLSTSLMLLIVLSTSRSEAMGDPWPLVNAADRAVWGTLIHTSTGPNSRLLVVRPNDNVADGGVPPIRLVDTIVGLPEGTDVMMGQRGLFLAKTAVPADAGFPALEGTVMVGGFIPGRPSDLVCTAIDRLIAGDLAATPFSEEDALALLGSEWGPAPFIALGWWNMRGTIGDDAKSALDATLATDDSTWLQSTLEVYLRHEWVLPTGGLATMVVDGRDPVLVDLAIIAIESQGGAAARADLLLAWPSATGPARVRLLGAYARLHLEESLPCWQEALAADDPLVWSTAIRELGRTRIPGCIEAYRPILKSKDAWVLTLAVDGLAAARNASAAALLREFRAELKDDDPLALKTDRALRQPGRVRKLGLRGPSFRSDER